MYYKNVPDPRDNNKLVATSLIDGYQSRFVKSSEYGRKSAVGQVLEHNQRIVDYLTSTGQLAADVTDPAVIGEVWKNRRPLVPKLGTKFYITQHADIANHREVRSLIDGHRIPYHAINVMKAIAEMEAYNAELVRTLIEFRWLAVDQSHELAAVVAAYKSSIREQN